MLEVTGPRGGVQLVHVMACGHWMTSRKPATELGCIGCAIAASQPHGMSARQLATKAVERAVDDALGEVARQAGYTVDSQIMKEARGAGIFGASVYLDEIR